MKKAWIMFCCLICLFYTASAQQEDLGNWIMYFGQNKISEHWSIHSEVQYRNHTVMPDIEQLLLRAGMNYHINSSFMVTAGYGYVSSHAYDSEADGPDTREHRIWQQLIIKNSLSRLFFEHRYRVEQRWVEEDYKNRLRYRLQVSVPLNKSTMQKGAVFINLYDEIFLNTRSDYFDRNRLYGALGYQAFPEANVQVGILNQAVSTRDKWYLQFAFFINPDFTKK